MHAGAVGVEDSGDANVDAVLPMVIEKQSLRAALPFVIAGTRPNLVDVAPVGLGLRVDRGVAVNLARRGLKNLALHALGQAQHVDRTMHRGLDGLDGVELIVNGRRRAGEVVDLVDLDIKRERYIVPKDFETRMADQMGDVVFGAGIEVVGANHITVRLEQAFT